MIYSSRQLKYINNIMDVRKLILQHIQKNGRIKTSDIIKMTGFSREYVNRFLRELRNEGKIILIGKANKSHYILADKQLFREAKKKILKIHTTLKNSNLSEDIVLDQIKRETGIFIDLKNNVSHILDYAFLEMLNNAIEHSRSKNIKITMKRDSENIRFDVIDFGIGAFNNIMKKKHLNNRLEAIQDLLKGKQTTIPDKHSGQGIFFTSKMADNFVVESSNKKLIFNNIVDDVFVNDIRNFDGTKVIFMIALNSIKKARNIFDKYSGDFYEFSKTKVNIKLYKLDSDYISRSQARRIISGLDKFKIIILDFKGVKTIGQAFADEIFRVWQKNYPKIEIKTKNTNENIDFMINRAIK